MAYGGTKAFFTKGYLIDYRKKKIDVEGCNGFWKQYFDLIGDLLIKMFTYGLLWTILVAIFLILGLNEQFKIVFLVGGYSALFIFFLIFDIYYINNNTKLASDLQMLLETPNFFFADKKEVEIQLHKTKEIHIHMNWYWKYWLTFRGECKKHRDFIKYITTPNGKDNIKIIKFKKRVNGTVIFKHKAGNISKIILK